MRATETPLEGITFDARIYPRTSPAWQIAHGYTLALKAGAHFPPITVATVNRKVVLIDGRHRMIAYKTAGKKTIPAISLGPMSEKNAYIAAVEANAKHGLQFLFKDRLLAYHRLQEYGIAKVQISAILSAPISELERFKATRMISSPAETFVIPKPVLPSKDFVQNSNEVKLMGGDDQVHLLVQVCLLIENQWLDMTNEDVVAGVVRLKQLVNGISVRTGMKKK